jgi:hypothetical protein
MTPIACKQQAHDAGGLPSASQTFRVQSILMDIARTWERLAIEAAIGQRSGPSLRVISELPS